MPRTCRRKKDALGPRLDDGSYFGEIEFPGVAFMDESLRMLRAAIIAEIGEKAFARSTARQRRA